MCCERYVRVHVVSRKFYKTQCYFSMRCRNSKTYAARRDRSYPQGTDNQMKMGAMHPAALGDCWAQCDAPLPNHFAKAFRPRKRRRIEIRYLRTTISKNIGHVADKPSLCMRKKHSLHISPSFGLTFNSMKLSDGQKEHSETKCQVGAPGRMR